MKLRLTKDIQLCPSPLSATVCRMNKRNDLFCRSIINKSVLQTRIVSSQECKKTKRSKTKVKLIKLWDYPAVAVTCFYYDGQFAHSNFSREVFPNSYNPSLTKRLNGIDGKKKIGDHRGDTIIGHCAEPHAANQTMNEFFNKNKKITYPSFDSIFFSLAKRPRTMEIIPTCQNCKDTFPNLNK